MKSYEIAKGKYGAARGKVMAALTDKDFCLSLGEDAVTLLSFIDGLYQQEEASPSPTVVFTVAKTRAKTGLTLERQNKALAQLEQSKLIALYHFNDGRGRDEKTIVVNP